MTDDRQVGDDTGDVVTQPPGFPTLRARRIFGDRPTVDVREFFAEGRAGNRDTEFDGSADGIGDKVGSLQYGSCGGRGRRREPSSSQHRALYILCLV